MDLKKRVDEVNKKRTTLNEELNYAIENSPKTKEKKRILVTSLIILTIALILFVSTLIIIKTNPINNHFTEEVSVYQTIEPTTYIENTVEKFINAKHEMTCLQGEEDFMRCYKNDE